MSVSEDTHFQSYGSEWGCWLILLFVTPILKKDIFNNSPGQQYLKISDTNISVVASVNKTAIMFLFQINQAESLLSIV